MEKGRSTGPFSLVKMGGWPPQMFRWLSVARRPILPAPYPGNH